mmetsp:Transcript_22175/g.33630  ORF Transcript_22175/g.33630 Transcript_22175/m.33630 type:complete len:199 (+) Transcript_22175:79-675(+)
MIRRKMKCFCWMLCWSTAAAFVAPGGLEFVSKPLMPLVETTLIQKIERTSTCIQLSDDENDKEEPQKETETNVTTESVDIKNSKTMMKSIWEGVYSLYSTLIIGIGGALSIGLLLNLNGYGYSFSREGGLRIDTIDEMRMERQLQQVSKPLSENQPTSPLSGVGTFLMRRPFAASLSVTGAVLFLEEIKGSKPKQDPE